MNFWYREKRSPFNRKYTDYAAEIIKIDVLQNRQS